MKLIILDRDGVINFDSAAYITIQYVVQRTQQTQVARFSTEPSSASFSASVSAGGAS